MFAKKYPIVVLLTLLAVSSIATLPVAASNCDRGEQLYNQAMAITDTFKKIELLEQAQRICENYAIYYRLGSVYLTTEQLDKAEINLKKAFSLDEATELEKGKALLLLGQIAEKHNDLAGAITSYEQALRLYQFPPQVSDYLMELELEKNRMGYSKEEIIRELDTKKRAFGVEPSLNLPIHFEYNQAKLNKSGRRQASELGEALLDKKFPGRHITLLGHTDIRGSDVYNLKLSRDRAEAVKEFLLLNYPLQDFNISTEGLGEKHPLKKGNSEEAHTLNRRVELKIE